MVKVMIIIMMLAMAIMIIVIEEVVRLKCRMLLPPSNVLKHI